MLLLTPCDFSLISITLYFFTYCNLSSILTICSFLLYVTTSSPLSHLYHFIFFTSCNLSSIFTIYILLCSYCHFFYILSTTIFLYIPHSDHPLLTPSHGPSPDNLLDSPLDNQRVNQQDNLHDNLPVNPQGMRPF